MIARESPTLATYSVDELKRATTAVVPERSVEKSPEVCMSAFSEAKAARLRCGSLTDDCAHGCLDRRHDVLSVRLARPRSADADGAVDDPRQRAAAGAACDRDARASCVGMCYSVARVLKSCILVFALRCMARRGRRTWRGR